MKAAAPGSMQQRNTQPGHVQRRVRKVVHPRVYQQTDTNTTWCIHPMKYDSAIEGNKVLLHTTAMVNLENFMLSERRRRCVDPDYMFSE